MNRKESEQNLTADTGLDEALARMAEEVPPMPADFHDRWMNAVRAEAREAAPAAEDTTPNKTVSLVRWTRILSVAAAFVFLIGGTLLWRNTKQTLSASGPAEKREAEAYAAPATEEPAVMAAGVMSDAEEAEAPADAAVPMPVAESEVATIEDAEEAAEGTADLFLSLKTAGSAMNVTTITRYNIVVYIRKTIT